MQFGVLGPVQVSGPAGIVDVGGARQRRLLAALILHAGDVVSTDRLLDIVFEGVPPSGANTTIRSYVARLRKALGDAEPSAELLISTEQGGYRLRVDIDSIDAARVKASIETARRQLGDRDPIGAAASLRTGLELWRGDAYGEFTFEEWARPEALRLEELRTVAEEELNDALLVRAGSRRRFCDPRSDRYAPAPGEAPLSADVGALPGGAPGRGAAQSRGVPAGAG